MQREIEFDEVINKLYDEEKIDQEQIDKLYEYVYALKEQINDLKSEVDSLEYDLEEAENERDSLQDEIDEEKEYQNTNLLEALKEITEERYKYSNGFSYDTKEKILDRLESILKYGV